MGGDVVGRIVAAANEIATTPYVYGGGHGGNSGGYDCSGSISYALAAGGLLSGALDSSGFMGWGEAGPGRRITVYANPGHAFMVVDGRLVAEGWGTLVGYDYDQGRAVPFPEAFAERLKSEGAG